MPTMTVNGLELDYQVTDLRGPFDRRPEWVVFVHGLHSSSQHWFNQVPDIARQYRVVTLDLRGHGRSDTPEAGYEISDYTADVLGVIDQLGIESAHIVGGSAGGFIAQELARTIPQTVRSVTLTGTAARVLTSFSPETLTAGVREHGIDAYFRDFARESTFSPDVSEQVFEWVMGIMLAAKEDLILRRIVDGLAYDGLDRLSDIHCPALVVTGEYDGTFPVEQSVELWRGLPQGQLAIIPRCGHLPQLETPTEYTAILRRFLRFVDGTSVSDDYL